MQIIITQRVTEEQKEEGKAPIAIAKLLAPPPTQSPRAAAAVGGIDRPRLAGESTSVGFTSGTGLALTHTHLDLVHSINHCVVLAVAAARFLICSRAPRTAQVGIISLDDEGLGLASPRWLLDASRIGHVYLRGGGR